MILVRSIVLFMARWDNTTNIDKLFTKWFVDNKGTNKVPEFYASFLRNLRIINNWITVRNWFSQIYDWESVNPIKAIVYNANNDKLLAVVGSTLYDIDIDAWTASSIGTIGAWDKIRPLVYGDFTIFLDGVGAPYYYDGTTLSQTTEPWEIAAWVDPEFWAVFAWFTVINNKDQQNVINISRPITLANQWYCHDWAGSDSEQITTKGKIQWFWPALNRLWIFTDQSIEYIDRNNITTTWWVASLFTVVTWAWDEMASPDSIVTAGDAVFFLTKNKQIKVLGYSWWITEPQLQTISDVEGASIQRFLNDTLKEDQSSSFWFFDRKRNLIKRHLLWNDSDVPNIILIRDVDNSTWLVDEDKFYSCMTKKWDRIYAWSAFSQRIYEDETKSDDNWQPIEWSFVTQNMTLWDPARPKQFRWFNLAWQIDTDAEIQINVFVDDNSVFSKTIAWTTYLPAVVTEWIWWAAISETAIWWDLFVQQQDLSDFEYVVTHWNLKATGKKIRFEFSWTKPLQDFVLDYLNITYRLRQRYKINDK